jgi:hypothetical protein
MTQYRFTTSALTELIQAIIYYERREQGLGTIFLDEIEADSSASFKTGLRGTHYLNGQDVVELTAFHLVYQIRKEEILIVSVMDLRRDPLSWEDLI